MSGFSFEVTGMKELSKALEKAGKEAEKIASKGLYKGAGITADALSGSIDGIPTEPFHYAKNGKRRKPSPEEKALVKNSKHGVARFKKTGTNVSTSVGFQGAGYGQINGKTVPVAMIANQINSGNSFIEKQPFFRKAVKQSEGKAAKAIEDEITSQIDELSLD